MKTVTPRANTVVPGPASLPAVNPTWAWHYRTLRALRARLLEATAAKRQSVAEPIETHSMHQADSGSDEFDHDFSLTLLAREEGALHEIDAALARIAAGTYGLCEATWLPIPAERLRAIPWCRYAREAEAKLEAQGRVTSQQVPGVISVRGPSANIPYTGTIAREGMEGEPVEPEEPKPGPASESSSPTDGDEEESATSK